MKIDFQPFEGLPGNVAVFVAADKRLQPSAQAIDSEAAGASCRAIRASRFTGAKGQSLTLLGRPARWPGSSCWASARRAN